MVKRIDKPIYDGFSNEAKRDNNEWFNLSRKMEKEWLDQKKRNIKKIENQSTKKPAFNKETSWKVTNDPKEEKETNSGGVINNQENNNPSDQTNQNNINIDKDTLIAELKTEIVELKKNLDPNNAEQKTILAQKETELAKLLVSIQQSQKKGDKSVKHNKPNNKLPAGVIWGGMGSCFFVLLIMVVLNRKRRKKQK